MNYEGDLNNVLIPGIYWCTAVGTTNRPSEAAGALWSNVSGNQALYGSHLFITTGNKYFFRSLVNGVWTSWAELASKSDLNNIIIRKTYTNVVSGNNGDIVLSDVPNGYRIISAVTETYLYGCFVSGNYSIRFYRITNSGSPVRVDNEKIGTLTVTFVKNL